MVIAHSSFAIADADILWVKRGRTRKAGSTADVDGAFASESRPTNCGSAPIWFDDRRTMQNETTNQIEDRLIDFAVGVINLTAKMPRTFAGTHIAQQLLRAATSPAPNYGESRAAESRADFIHKLRIALKELNEPQIWLKLAQRARLIAADTASPVLDECRQLSRILTVSIRTARSNAQPSNR